MRIEICSCLVFHTTHPLLYRIAQHYMLFEIHWNHQQLQLSRPILRFQNCFVGLSCLKELAMYLILDHIPSSMVNVYSINCIIYLCCFKTWCSIKSTNGVNVSIRWYYRDATTTWSHRCYLSPNIIRWTIELCCKKTFLTIETSRTIYTECKLCICHSRIETHRSRISQEHEEASDLFSFISGICSHCRSARLNLSAARSRVWPSIPNL